VAAYLLVVELIHYLEFGSHAMEADQFVEVDAPRVCRLAQN